MYGYVNLSSHRTLVLQEAGPGYLQAHVTSGVVHINDLQNSLRPQPPYGLTNWERYERARSARMPVMSIRFKGTVEEMLSALREGAKNLVVERTFGSVAEYPGGQIIMIDTTVTAGPVGVALHNSVDKFLLMLSGDVTRVIVDQER